MGLKAAHSVCVTSHEDALTARPWHELPADLQAELSATFREWRAAEEAAQACPDGARIPLTEGGHIVCANALTTPWEDVRPPEDTDFILGNPPFLGSRIMDKGQKAELRAVAKGYQQAGFLDFVAGWYILAARFMDKNPAVRTALVSTNSITQGEQPGILWKRLLADGFHINFGYRTFNWTNDAKGVAHVHCVIVGFSRVADPHRELYSFTDLDGEPVLELTSSINPYLVPGREYVVANRENQVSGESRMSFGNMAADGGNLLMTREQRDELVGREPGAADWIKPFVGSTEFINGTERYCLWLEGITAGQLRSMPAAYARVQATKVEREKSARPQLAATPHLFAQITQSPRESFLLVPSVSSQRRRYVPMGFFEPGTVASNLVLTIQHAILYHFGILTSQMHMDWLRLVGGRLKSDYRYSKDIVYNNFVFPAVSDEQRTKVEQLAQAVLDARTAHPGDTLADLYDDVAMPVDLRAAHSALDRHVDNLYRSEPFEGERDRGAYLLALHEAVAQN